MGRAPPWRGWLTRTNPPFRASGRVLNWSGRRRRRPAAPSPARLAKARNVALVGPCAWRAACRPTADEPVRARGRLRDTAHLGVGAGSGAIVTRDARPLFTRTPRQRSAGRRAPGLAARAAGPQTRPSAVRAQPYNMAMATAPSTMRRYRPRAPDDHASACRGGLRARADASGPPGAPPAGAMGERVRPVGNRRLGRQWAPKTQRLLRRLSGCDPAVDPSSARAKCVPL